MVKNAIESALAQGSENVQHVIQDGGSCDGTLELLAEYPHLEVISEPDCNLYDAWNKGIARAHGDIVCILNSDDILPAGAFNAVRRAFAENPNTDLVSGPVELVNLGEHSGRLIGTPEMLRLRQQDISAGLPLTNGRYFTKRLLENVGDFDTRYSAWSDRQYLMRVLLSGAKNTIVSAPLYRYTSHEGSLTFNRRGPNLTHLKEARKIAVDGMREANNVDLYRAYRQWHAWATLYLSVYALRTGRVALASSVSFKGFSADPFWLTRGAKTTWLHWREREYRKGLDF